MVKNPPAAWKTWFDPWIGKTPGGRPLEEGMATHSSILAWRIRKTGAWWVTVHGVSKSQM